MFYMKEQNCFIIIKNGYKYLGSFMGNKKLETEWLVSKIDDWIEAVGQVAEIAKYVTQSAYAGMQRALQQEWTFVQRVVPNIALVDWKNLFLILFSIIFLARKFLDSTDLG